MASVSIGQGVWATSSSGTGSASGNGRGGKLLAGLVWTKPAVVCGTFALFALDVYSVKGIGTFELEQGIWEGGDELGRRRARPPWCLAIDARRGTGFFKSEGAEADCAVTNSFERSPGAGEENGDKRGGRRRGLSRSKLRHKLR